MEVGERGKGKSKGAASHVDETMTSCAVKERERALRRTVACRDTKQSLRIAT